MKNIEAKSIFNTFPPFPKEFLGVTKFFVPAGEEMEIVGNIHNVSFTVVALDGTGFVIDMFGGKEIKREESLCPEKLSNKITFRAGEKSSFTFFLFGIKSL